MGLCLYTKQNETNFLNKKLKKTHNELLAHIFMLQFEEMKLYSKTGIT